MFVQNHVSNKCTGCAHRKVCRFVDAYNRLYSDTMKRIQDMEDKTMSNADGQFTVDIGCKDFVNGSATPVAYRGIRDGRPGILEDDENHVTEAGEL